MFTPKTRLATQPPRAIPLIRPLVGVVFLSAGPWSLDARLAGGEGQGT